MWCNVDGGRGGVKDWEGKDLQTLQQRSGTGKATDVWRTVRGAPHFTTVPACSSGAESTAVTLKLYYFHPEPGQEARAIPLLWNTGRSHHSFTHLKERKKGYWSFSFYKIDYFNMTSSRVSPFSLYSAAWLIFFSSEYLSRPDNWNPLKCSSNAILVMFWLRLFFFFFFCTGVNLVFVWKPCVRGHFLWHPWTTKRRAAERRRDGWVWNGGWRAFHFYCSTVLILKCNSPGK